MSDLCNPELLEKIVDGSATSFQRAAFDEHAVECVTCARELAWQRREQALFAARKARAVGPLWKDVEAQISAPPARRSASWMAGLVAAAAAVLLLVKSVPMALHHDATTPVVVGPAAALPAASSSSHEQAWHFDLRPGDLVDVHDIDGSVSVTGVDGGDLHVVASSDDDLGGWVIHAERKGTKIAIGVDCPHTCGEKPSVDFEVRVPTSSGASVGVDTVSADVEVERLGNVRVHTVSGDVEVKASTGSIVSTTSGDVTFEDAPSAVTKIDSVSGGVTWSGTCAKGCDLQVTTVSGDVDVTPDDDSRYDVDIRSSESTHAHKRNGASGKIRVRTKSGDVEVPDDEGESAHDEGQDEKQMVVMSSSLGGRVSKVEVKVGDRVKAGQTLVVFDPSALNARLAVLDAEQADALRALEAREAGLDSGTVTRAQFMEARAAVKRALAKLDAAGKSVDLLSVTAMLGGVVTAVHVHAGDSVAPKAELVTLSTK